jgi:beta-N-acetylhexosaminidase
VLRIYKELIAYGADSVMSAHIKQPALSRLVNGRIEDHEILPGSLSAELNRGILRERLGFNGLIVTDATQMVGFTASMPRPRAVPTAIANGADMFMFTINHGEDVQCMLDGLENGLLSPQRLDEAVTRVLALKASLGLHRKQAEGSLVPPESALEIVRCDEHVKWAADCADSAVTLVKDRDGLLPISPARFARIELVVVTNEDQTRGRSPEVELFKSFLEAEGFDVRYSEAVDHPSEKSTLADYRKDVDLLLYYANMKVGSNQTAIRIEWKDFLGSGSPKYVRDIPTIFVSFSNPYHLVDVPMVPTYVNAYSSNEYVVRAVVEKLAGRSTFKGVSPVDPTCGLWDALL